MNCYFSCLARFTRASWIRCPVDPRLIPLLSIWRVVVETAPVQNTDVEGLGQHSQDLTAHANLTTQPL